MRYLSIKALLLIVPWAHPCLGQYHQDYSYDQSYSNLQGYDTYQQQAYDPGTSYYSSYGYGYPSYVRTAEDTNSDSAIKAAMSPLNSVVSSVAAQGSPPSLFGLMQPVLPKSAAPLPATPVAAAQPVPTTDKKSNCTKGCSAAAKMAQPEAKSAPAEPKSQDQQFQPGITQSQISALQHQAAQHHPQEHTPQQLHPCPCPCWSYGMYPQYYQPQYPKPAPAYNRPKTSYRQYRPTYPWQGYYRPVFSGYYYDPNYHRGYYATLRH